MKNKSKFAFFVAINYLLLIITHAKIINYEGTNTVVPELTQLLMGNIVAGAGYSSDSQQVTSQKCFNGKISSISGQQGNVHLSAALSFSDLQSQLGMSVSVSGKYEMFATDVKATYMRSVEDKDYTISLNYYQSSSNNVAVQISDSGVNALTEFGKSIYKDTSNPHFGLECGDNYISSYQQGALLIMGLNIQLNSSLAKQEFNAQAGVAFGDIVDAASNIKKISAKSNINGVVTIQAFQMGGEPSQLSKILSSSDSGQFYALACSLSAMENCISAANGLLHYAKDNFAEQLSFEKNIGLTPLGVGFMKYSPISYIGLNLPVSLVTQEVKEYRQELSDLLKKNQYYQQKVYSLLNAYPVTLGATSTLLKMLNLISSRTEKNILILMQPHNSAADCFTFPQNCKKIRDNIVSQLQDITISDLKFLENMKYKVSVLGKCTLYYTGEAPDLWTCLLNDSKIKKVEFCKERPIITDEKCSFCVRFINNDGSKPSEISYTGNYSYRDNYIGPSCWTDTDCINMNQERSLSPFFFNSYKNKLSDK